MFLNTEHFGVCSDCPYPKNYFGSINPFRQPYSGSSHRSQWGFSPGNVKPPNNTDDAEALTPPNKSSMNVLSMPDQEYLTN